MADNQYISPFVKDGDKFRSADKTSYDITNKNPAGGPINDPTSGFTHTYSPDNKYLDNFGEGTAGISSFGLIGNGSNYATVLDDSIFEKTELDIENPKPLGGPNRTNIPDIPGGIYTTAKTSTEAGVNPFPNGILKNTDGTPYKVAIQQYSKDKTYLESLKDVQIPLNEL